MEFIDTQPPPLPDLTFHDYQEGAAATAVFPKEIAETYLLLGLMGELGEVADVWKKHLRKGAEADLEKTRGLMRIELGDVWWYLALNARHVDSGWAPEWLNPGPRIESGFDLSEEVFGCLRNVDDLILHRGKHVHLSWGPFESLCLRLTRIGEYFGFSRQDIWHANLEKLARRKAKGELKERGPEDPRIAQARAWVEKYHVPIPAGLVEILGFGDSSRYGEYGD